MPSSIQQWPYAAKAVVQHDWQDPVLSLWVTFRFPMDQTVKPPNALWLCKVNGVLKAVTVSAWQDEWTILLTIPAILALPGTVTLAYDGPDANLHITWDKQWEPFGPILSIRIPYLWEDIIVVDTTNRCVGINGPPTQFTFEILSLDFSDRISIYHDNTNAFIKWDDGDLNLQTDEGTNTTTYVHIHGKGTSRGFLQIYDQDDSDFLQLTMFDVTASILTRGTSPGDLRLQHTAHASTALFSEATSGETEELRITGFRAGDAKRSLDIGVGVDAPDTASFDGLSTYFFDGDIHAAGTLYSGTRTFNTGPAPQDDVDVTGINTLFLDCSANDVVIGGLVGGLNGQILHIARLCAAANDATLEHNEGAGNQDILLHAGADETLTGEYGGWTLVCNGTNWYDLSHAKHV